LTIYKGVKCCISGKKLQVARVDIVDRVDKVKAHPGYRKGLLAFCLRLTAYGLQLTAVFTSAY